MGRQHLQLTIKAITAHEASLPPHKAWVTAMRPQPHQGQSLLFSYEYFLWSLFLSFYPRPFHTSHLNKFIVPTWNRIQTWWCHNTCGVTTTPARQPHWQRGQTFSVELFAFHYTNPSFHYASLIYLFVTIRVEIAGVFWYGNFEFDCGVDGFF